MVGERKDMTEIRDFISRIVEDVRNNDLSDTNLINKYVHEIELLLKIEIGDYELGYYHSGDFWLMHNSGEGMQVNKDTFAKYIDEFYKKNF